MAQTIRITSTSRRTTRNNDAEGDWPDSEPEVETRRHTKAKRGLPTEYDSTYTKYPSRNSKPYVDPYRPYATRVRGRSVPHNPLDDLGTGPAPPQAAPYQPPPPPPPLHPNPAAPTTYPPGMNQMNQSAYQNPYYPNMPPYSPHPSQYANNIPPVRPPPNYFPANPHSYPSTTQAQFPRPIIGGTYYGTYPSVPPKGVSSFGGPPVSRPKERRVITQATPSRQQYDIELVNQRLDDLFLDREHERARRSKRRKEAAKKAEMARSVERVRKDVEKTFGTKIDELRRELQIRDLEMRFETGRRGYAATELSRPAQSVYSDWNSALGRGDEMANIVEGKRRYERQHRTGSRPTSVLSSHRDPRMALARRATSDIMQDSERVRDTIQDLEYRLSMMEQRDINRQRAATRQQNGGESRRRSSSRRARSDSRHSTYRDGASEFLFHPHGGQSEEGYESWDERPHLDRRQDQKDEAYWAGRPRKAKRAAAGRTPHYSGSNNSAPPLKSAMRANGASRRRGSSYETNEAIRAARAAMDGHTGHETRSNPTYEEVFFDDDDESDSDEVVESPELFPERDASYPSMYKIYSNPFLMPAAPEAGIY